MFSRMKILNKFRVSLTNLSQCREISDFEGGLVFSKLFFDKTVQGLLRSLIREDVEKVFKIKGSGKPLEPVKYVLMTDEQLKAAKEQSKIKLEEILQIPPLVNVKPDIPEILKENPSIDGFDEHHSKYIFTDISVNTTNESRQIVVRQPNGVLRTAHRSERHKVNQIYFPINGREIIMPKMFEDEHLNNVLKRNEYKFILDRACIQFEPDEPMFHKVIKKTFDKINTDKHFEMIQSTRHYGALAFYLVTYKSIDDLLIDIIKNQRIDCAYNLVKLFHIIHPDCKSAVKSQEKDSDILENFIKLDARKGGVLELELENFKKIQEEKEKLEINIKQAHGV